LFLSKSPLLQQLDLTQDEKDQLLAFLEALSERPRRVRSPLGLWRVLDTPTPRMALAVR
jgi:hypothetical protein